MEQVLKDSFTAYSDQLAIFDKPIQNVGVKDVRCIEFQPVNDYTSQSAVEFNIPSNSAYYVDLKKTILHVRCKVTKADGSSIHNNIDKGTVVGVVNNFLNSMFSRCDLALQDHVMTSSDQTYAYRAYFDNLLYTNSQQKVTSLQTELYYPETGSKMTSYNCLDPEGNPLLIERSKLFDKSEEVDMEGVLHLDVTKNMDRYLLPGVSIKIKLYPSSPEFCLFSADVTPSYKVIITKASLKVCFVDVAPEISVAHSEILKSGIPAIYPYIKVEVKKFTIPAGVFSSEIFDPFQGRIPSEMVMGLVKESALHGSYTENPFYFENAALNFLQVSVDGKDLNPGLLQPKYSTSFESSKFVSAYNTLKSVDNLGMSSAIPISKSDYYNGYCLYRFYTEAACDTDPDALPLKRTGNLRISMNFDTKLARPMTFIVYAKFPCAFKIDASRSVYTV